MSTSIRIQKLDWQAESGTLTAHWTQSQAILFEPDVQLVLLNGDQQVVATQFMHQSGEPVEWLVEGKYSLDIKPNFPDTAPGEYRAQIIISAVAGGERQVLASADTSLNHETAGSDNDEQWKLHGSREPGGEWFRIHFDHAARVIIDLLLDGSPQLQGKILDVGCGDGVTDVGVFLRCMPELLIGVDPFKGFERLPRILEENGIPESVLNDPRLRFEPHSGNQLPYDDDAFDVVLSWGSLEHIAGGYDKALLEIRRVLKPGGLFFVHPGLYYSTLGNHLGEFFDDPFIHLKIPEDELQEKVLSTEPRYMDRAGYFAQAKDYWRWFTELNPITVPEMEQELRALGFEPWRVALRTADLIEYTPELQKYGMSELATAEMYASFVLRAD